MLETIAIISNGIVVIAIGALYAKINSHGKELNNHVVYTVKEITKRPDFPQFRQELKDLKAEQCKKTTKLEVAFQHHVHEGSSAKVVL